MDIPARVSLVTLGVRDIPTSAAFYRAWGWEPVIEADDGMTLFHTAGALLALYPVDALARDGAREDLIAGSGFRGMSLAINLESNDAVDEAVGTAVAAGARVTRPGSMADWGGYTAYIADPDGHAWEIAHNPFWPLDDRGLPNPRP